MAASTDGMLKMSELAERSGVSAGTIKHYLREGLLGRDDEVVRTSRNMAYYPLEFVENAWTEKHLPEFSDVQREQLEQRRAYGLEILSVPQEREVRELFRSGKEVMPKDK